MCFFPGGTGTHPHTPHQIRSSLAACSPACHCQLAPRLHSQPASLPALTECHIEMAERVSEYNVCQDATVGSREVKSLPVALFSSFCLMICPQMMFLGPPNGRSTLFLSYFRWRVNSKTRGISQSNACNFVGGLLINFISVILLFFHLSQKRFIFSLSSTLIYSYLIVPFHTNSYCSSHSYYMYYICTHGLHMG